MIAVTLIPTVSFVIVAALAGCYGGLIATLVSKA